MIEVLVLVKQMMFAHTGIRAHEQAVVWQQRLQEVYPPHAVQVADAWDVKLHKLQLPRSRLGLHEARILQQFQG